MTSIIRYTGITPEFKMLTSLLDADLRERYGDAQDDYDQYNNSDKLKNFVVAFVNDDPAACGAFKFFEEGTAEIKRMFVKKEFRGRGISRKILMELERWARESGYRKAILETGVYQQEAIGLYTSAGYKKIENYGQYINKIYSCCMMKEL